MMKAHLSCAIALMWAAGAVGCGGSGGGGPSGGEQAVPEAGGNMGGGDVATTPADAGTPPEAAVDEAPPPVDHGAPSTTYPAFAPSFGQIVDNGGYKMKSPIIVAVTWNSDPSQATFDSFADALGSTSYWTATTAEYGVGSASSGASNHVHVGTPAPATLQDSDLQALVTANAGAAQAAGDGGAEDAGVAEGAEGGTGGWPAPTRDTIYAFFLPPGTSVLVSSGSGPAQDACAQGIGGYHDQVSVGLVTTAYAVVPSCNFGGGITPEQQTTMSMSHELIEAATDPQPQASLPGVVGFDSNHFAFDDFQMFQDETGDACELYAEAFYQEFEQVPAFDYWVQRTWSNKSALAGHNPCVPAPAGAYFNVTPLDLQTVNVNLPPQLTGLASATQMATKGYQVLAGSSATFAVGFYSDGPTNGTFSISASLGNPITGSGARGKASLTATIDKTKGQNGEKAYVTVNVTTTGTTFKGELLTIVSTLGNMQHFMPIWIAGE
jgi:hypothetical protein